MRIEVNALGRVMRELDRVEGIKGRDVQLTLDAQLQAYVEARIEGESAAVVVMDCATGDLLAVGNAPSFDPNLFVRGISVADWTALNENRYRPLANKVVQDAYPPGSTFKMIVALAALEAGVIQPEDTVYCPGFVTVSGTRFHCWRSGGHGNVNLHDSLKVSCDVYYYEIGQRVGIDAIAAMARRLGLGVRHDVPMSAIAEGIAPDRDWKRARYGEDWRIGDTVNASIGQGYVLATPLQLAVMAARLATGRAVSPRLVKTIAGWNSPPAPESRWDSTRTGCDASAPRCMMWSITSAARPSPTASSPPACRWPARPAPVRCAASPPRSAQEASHRMPICPGSGATMRCGSISPPMTIRVLPSRSSSSMAVAAGPWPPPSGGT